MHYAKALTLVVSTKSRQFIFCVLLSICMLTARIVKHGMLLVATDRVDNLAQVHLLLVTPLSWFTKPLHCAHAAWSLLQQMKPIRTGGPVSRYVRSLLVVPDSGQAALFSSKINFSVFRLQFVLAYNWKQNTPSLDYRYSLLGLTKRAAQTEQHGWRVCGNGSVLAARPDQHAVGG